MPAIDPNANRAAPRPKQRVRKKNTTAAPARPKPAPRVNVRPPDAADRSKAAREQQLKRSVPMTPDQADRKRSPAQQARDKQVTAKVVRQSRVKALRKKRRGAGVRAVKKIAGGAGTGLRAAAGNIGVAFGASNDNRRTPTRGGASATQFATMPMPAARVSAAEPGGRFLKNAGKDAAEIITGTVPSTIELAKTAVKDPKKAGEMLVEPYKNLAKNPGKEFFERPISSALMVQPVVRMPGRAAGRVARATGKQTLERPDATLPGTALREKRTGSRDVVVRAVQSREDKKNPAPTVTARDVQRRVDEHHELAKGHVRRAEKKANRASRGRTREERAQAAKDARDQAQREMDERFAREFGANQRPSTGHAERDAARADRETAVGRVAQARGRIRDADAEHDQALAAARAARARVKTSTTLRSLEQRRRDAQRDLSRAQRAAASAGTKLGVARGRAEVLSRNVGGKAGGHGVHLASKTLDERAKAVRDARARIRDLDKQIAAERKRISGVPPAEHQRLVKSIDARADARGALASARKDADTARARHITTKKAMAGASLIDDAPEGRLFDHEADAHKVAERLNETGRNLRQGGKLPGHFTVHDKDAPKPVSWSKGYGTEPLEFTVRQAGDRWAVVPKVASTRLSQHHAVGSSPNAVAKVLRRSGDAFGQAVLPLSLKWMAGQVAEPAVRAAVAGAGPADLLRTRKVVKRMNRDQPGSGDELLRRISSDKLRDLGLGDDSREATRGKSLAHEFEHSNPLVRGPAAAATMAGNTAPARVVRKAWNAYTDKVIGSVNAAIESTARQAMAGQALKNSQHMERRIVGLSDRAIADAAKGLKGTEAQVELARTIDRMYGQYSKFSPDRRSWIMHWARFLPWFLNAATFLTRTLPVDHPVQAALLADINTAMEEWRTDEGLSYRNGDDGGLPDFLLGSYPAGGGDFYRLSQFTPAGLGPDPGASAVALVLPQFQGALRNTAGFDWKNQRLRGRDGEDFNQAENTLRALFSLSESHLPGVGKAGRVTGLTERHIDQEDDEDIPPLRARLERELPWTPTKGTSNSSSSGVKVKPIKVRPVRVKPIKVKPIKGS